MKSRLTKEEKAAMKLSGKLWNALHAMKKLHPNEKVEFCKSITDIQKQIMARPEIRVFNKSQKRKR